MEVINAIAKVRFGSARPQRVQLHTSDDLTAELLCLEAGHKLKITSGQWTYYVVAGNAAIDNGGKSTELPTGQFAATGKDEAHTIANAGEGRLICLAVGISD